MTFGSPHTLGMSVTRQGMSMIVAGLVWGFFIPETPFPRLALTAHIQFEAEGAMVLLAGILLNSRPFSHSDVKLASTLSLLQSRIVLVSCLMMWPVLLSEVANSWWGTKNALPILYATGVSGDWNAKQWQELIVAATHYGGAPFIVMGMGIVLYALFKEPKSNLAGKMD